MARVLHQSAPDVPGRVFLKGNAKNRYIPKIFYPNQVHYRNASKNRLKSPPIGQPQHIASYLCLAAERRGTPLSVCPVSLSTVFRLQSANQRPYILFPTARESSRNTRYPSMGHQMGHNHLTTRAHTDALAPCTQHTTFTFRRLKHPLPPTHRT